MVLNKVRKQLNPILGWAGKTISRVGVTSEMLTATGFVLSVVSGIFYGIWASHPYVGALLLLASGATDVLDGAVARAANRVSKMGAFLDSMLDRLSEIAVYAGLAYGAEASDVSITLAAGLSLTVSYIRAKGEALGIQISGIGIGERAERLFIIIVSSLFGYAWLGIYFVIVVTTVTIIQRSFKVVSQIKQQR